MEELLRTAGAVATPLIAVAALILSIRASKRVKHQREFEIVLEENRREATRREDLFERERAERDKRFEKERAEREQQLQKERAEREAAARAFTERIDREAAKREAETRAFTERIDREAAKREAETRAFTEQIDREAAKREQQIERERAKREAAIQALIDRSDRRFDALLARSDELGSQLAEVVAQAVRNDTRVRVMEAARSRKEADPSAPAPGGTEAVAAQAVPSERRPK